METTIEINGKTIIAKLNADGCNDNGNQVDFYNASGFLLSTRFEPARFNQIVQWYMEDANEDA